MNTYKIEEIEEFSTFSEDVYLDKKFILLPRGIPLDAKLKAKMLESSFINVYSEGIVEDLGIRKEIEEEPQENTEEEVIQEEIPAETEEEKVERLQVENTYVTFLASISLLYSNFAAKQKLDVNAIFAKAREIYDYVKANKHKIIALSNEAFNEVEPPLILHVMRTAVFAIIIAIQVKMPEHRIIELVVSAILHKIGFLRIPPQIYNNSRSLSERDMKTFKSHPIVSYRILKDAKFPDTVCAGVLEHHERENGSGYPRALKSEDISIFGKILSVACSFEASTGTFHKNYAVNSVLEVVRNSDKQYSDIILKSLLFSISVFPIGTFVQLSDKRIGQVIDVNPENLAYPVVLIYGGMSAKGEAQIAKTSPDGVRVKKPLTKAEIDEVKRTRTAP